MINDKRMKLVKSENGINYYLFRPSLFSLYYNDREFKHKDEPTHRYSLSHRLHMMWYLLSTRGGYRILYLEQNGEVLSYIVFIKASNSILDGCGKNDYYTIFLWTYPEHRRKGLATLMSMTMLNDLSLKYDNFYKTISKENISSIRVAEKCGFNLIGNAMKRGRRHTIHKKHKGKLLLYSYSAK